MLKWKLGIFQLPLIHFWISMRNFFTFNFFSCTSFASIPRFDSLFCYIHSKSCDYQDMQLLKVTLHTSSLHYVIRLLVNVMTASFSSKEHLKSCTRIKEVSYRTTCGRPLRIIKLLWHVTFESVPLTGVFLSDFLSVTPAGPPGETQGEASSYPFVFLYQLPNLPWELRHTLTTTMCVFQRAILTSEEQEDFEVRLCCSLPSSVTGLNLINGQYAVVCRGSCDWQVIDLAVVRPAPLLFSCRLNLARWRDWQECSGFNRLNSDFCWPTTMKLQGLK